MSEEDDWVKSALSDDSLVAELLNRLRESVTVTLLHRRQLNPPLLDWGVRQPRSRNIPRFSHNHNHNHNTSSNDGNKQNKGELTRGSPTTPLSWSAGTSYSGGGGGAAGDEESSVRLSHTRSKLISPSEITKRSRKKKTFAQLKEQEGLLLRDGIHLKRALASERKLYEKEKIKNESLKRLKLDLQLQSTVNPCTSVDTLKKPTLNHDQAPAISPSCGMYNEYQKNDSVLHERPPVLPDLNMLPDLNFPFEEDFS